MNKLIPMGVGFGIVASTLAILFMFYPDIDSEPKLVEESPWITSGPFSINKNQYKIGEKIFYSIKNLSPNDKGHMIFLTPEEIIYNIQPFDGSEKCCFNQYFEPDTSASRKIYKVKQLVGTWNVIFNGTNYDAIQFEIIDERVPKSEAEIFDLPIPPKKPIGPTINKTD